MKEITLPSGAILKITLSSFAVSRELYKVVLEELKTIKIDGSMELDYNLFKDLACELLSSSKVEKALWECLKKATYNDFKITEDTFEDEKAREDYLPIFIEVGKANILPFMKNLSQSFSLIMGTLNNVQA